MNGIEITIAGSLVALVLVFIRISWTLKEIKDALCAGQDALCANQDARCARPESPRTGKGQESSSGAETAEAESSGPDETELAAVIAIASAAFRSQKSA